MTWISLICLLALSSSAFANHGQFNAYGSSLPRMNSLLTAMRDNTLRRPMLPTHAIHHQHKSFEQSAYGQQDQQPQLPTGYGSVLSVPRTLPVQGYGQINQGYGAARFLDQQPQVVPTPVILTEADNLCRGKAPETIIPLDDGSRFVVCLDDSKGTEQFCPKGLIYHLPSQRCERKYGPQNYCASQPCLNGGQCIPTESSYQCQCAAGFDGQICELDSRVCDTQRPCGNSPDARCQSFRLGAALPYICIFQDGQAYGLSPQQAVASPCQSVDGPQALSISDKGFIMCDGERMFVESCPGGTVWENEGKACAWPDIQFTTPQADQSYSYDSYGQSRQLVNKQSYGGSFEQPKLIQGYGSRISQKPKLIQGYGSQIRAQPQLDQEYGSKMTIQPQLDQGYGSKMTIQPQFDQGYGSKIPQPQLDQGYGSKIPQPQLDQGYGSKIPQPQLDQAYGSQISVQPPVPQQPQLDQGYGSQITIQPPVPQQPKLVQGSGY